MSENNRLCVLIVEDNRADARMVEEMIIETGLDVHIATASDGKAAIDTLEKRVPDLVILDLNLPMRDGYEVLESVRGLNPAKPPRVVVLTGSLLKGDRDKAIGLGAYAFLNKPTTIEDFDRISEALRNIILVVRGATSSASIATG